MQLVPIHSNSSGVFFYYAICFIAKFSCVSCVLYLFMHIIDIHGFSLTDFFVLLVVCDAAALHGPPSSSI